MTSPIVCIQHFFNEEYLLPWWIKFHEDTFDHVVFLDHGSTDGSCDVISEKAPTWEIRKSRLTSFDAAATDSEVMEIEREFKAWKIVLNTTEFLWAPSIRDDLARTDVGPFALPIEGKIMVDRHRNKPLCGTSPIPIQRPWCVNYESARGRVALGLGNAVHRLSRLGRRLHLSDSRVDLLPRSEIRKRFIHGAVDGQYGIGRHTTDLPLHSLDSERLVLWLGYSPWTAEFRRRKLQIGSRIPDSDRARGFGVQHLMSGFGMELVRALLALSSERGPLSPRADD